MYCPQPLGAARIAEEGQAAASAGGGNASDGLGMQMANERGHQLGDCSKTPVTALLKCHLLGAQEPSSSVSAVLEELSSLGCWEGRFTGATIYTRSSPLRLLQVRPV